MLWNIKSAENLISGDFVEFIKDEDGTEAVKNFRSRVNYCNRGIAEGELLTFDTNGDILKV